MKPERAKPEQASSMLLVLTGDSCFVILSAFEIRISSFPKGVGRFMDTTRVFWRTFLGFIVNSGFIVILQVHRCTCPDCPARWVNRYHSRDCIRAGWTGCC